MARIESCRAVEPGNKFSSYTTIGLTGTPLCVAWVLCRLLRVDAALGLIQQFFGSELMP